MKFQHLPLHDLEGATRNFEQLTATVLELATPGTARKVAFGQATGNFPNNNAMTALVVNHGLPTTPIVVLVTQIGGALLGVTQFDAGTYTATQFTINGNSTVVQNGNALLAWLAVG